MQFLWYFLSLKQRYLYSYKGVPIEKTIGSFTNHIRFEIRHVVSEIFDPEHHHFHFLQNMFGHNVLKFLRFRKFYLYVINLDQKLNKK